MMELKVVNKIIKFSSKPIPDAVYDAILTHQSKWRRLPLGILLGPTEWLEFHQFYRSDPRQRLGLLDKATFHGVPVYPKCRPGIDLIPEQDITPYLATGIVTERK